MTADPMLAGARAALAARYAVDAEGLALTRLALDDDRGWVARVAVHGMGKDGPASFIVKRPRGPRAALGDPLPAAHCAEWAALRFLDGSGMAPAFIAADPETGVLVLEDLAPVMDLCTILHGADSAPAESALIGYGRLLGQLHAHTAGRLADYTAIWTEVAPGRPLPSPGADLHRLVPRAEAACRAAGVEVGPEASVEAHRAVAAVQSPGALLTYVHGDPCPDNVLVTAAGQRLIDFEMGGFGCCLLDAAYPRLVWPTCWCAAALPANLLARFEQAYREALIIGVPRAADDGPFWEGMLAACAVHALWTLADVLPVALQAELAAPNLTYRGVSRPKRRSRVVHRLERFAATSAELGGMPAFAACCAALAGQLVRRWSDDADPLAPYPALTR